jgi:hypothetical protein
MAECGDGFASGVSDREEAVAVASYKLLDQRVRANVVHPSEFPPQFADRVHNTVTLARAPVTRVRVVSELYDKRKADFARRAQSSTVAGSSPS